MKTIEIKLYQFNELSEDAKQTALDHFRENEINSEYMINEAHESFIKFAEIFGIEWDNMDYIENYRSNYKCTLDDSILELSGQKLATYIWNNYKTDLYKGKYYGRLSSYDKTGLKIPISLEHPIGQRHVIHYSKCTIENSCVLTGMCYDDDLLEPIYNFMDFPTDQDFKDLLEDCLTKLCKTVQSGIDYKLSEEGLTESIECNDYDFTEEGKLY